LRTKRRRAAATERREVHEAAHAALPQCRSNGRHGDDDHGGQHANTALMERPRIEASPILEQEAVDALACPHGDGDLR